MTPKRFVLPRHRARVTPEMLRDRQRRMEELSAQERVTENTPCLLALYLFLKRPLPSRQS